MIQTDYSLLWMFLLAALAVAGIAVYQWWRKKNSLPDLERDYYTEGLNQMLDGRLKEAVASFTEAAHRFPDHIDAYLKLGSLLRQLGRPRRASHIHLDLSIRTDLPNYTLANVYRELALDLEQTGNSGKALRYLDKSRQLDPSNGDDLIIRQRIFESQGKWKEAGEALRKFTSVTGKHDPVKLALYKIEEGQVLQEEGKGHEARILYKEAFKTDPQAVEAYLFIAASYIREDRTDDAFEWLTRFIKETPGRAQDALSLLEGLLFGLGRFAEVEVILLEAIEKAPTNVALAHALIDLKVKKGEAAEAFEQCERALEASPGDLSLKLRHLVLLRRKGSAKEFEKRLEEIANTLAPIGEGYFCGTCGHHAELLMTHCPSCGSWRSFGWERQKN